MLHDPDDPYGATLFLENWALEVRGAYTPDDALDVDERLNEYLDTEVPPDIEAALVAEVRPAAAALVAEQQAAEATWAEPTTNDRLAAAFAELSARGVFARECLGLTQQDGWACAGQRVTDGARGVAFFTQQDVIDAQWGLSMFVAFGVPWADDADATAIGHEVLEALGRHGVAATWTGHAEDRIEVAPFTWARRRRGPMPVPAAAPVGVAITGRQESLFAPPTREALAAYVQPVYAYRTCDGYDSYLAAVMRGVWKAEFHGPRGQVAHFGDPHLFVRAGELAEMCPGDATTNLGCDEAAALWARGAASRATPWVPPAAKPWWRFWG